MTIVAHTHQFVIGLDTHARTHALSILMAATGAIVDELLKQAMALLVSFVIDIPKYGALAAPIGIMFVLYLQAIALYAVASLTAALAEIRAGG